MRTSLPQRYGPNRVPYKPIEDYGIIGDLNTVALVSKQGSIDWCCFPRFDSPSIFAALLDDKKGGYFQISARETTRHRQLYLPDTNVLVTRFMDKGGVGEVVDFMPLDGLAKNGVILSGRRRIVRRVSAVRGTVRFRLQCHPAFDYGRAKHEIVRTEHGVRFRGPNLQLELISPIEMNLTDDGVSAEFTLESGNTLVFILQQHEEGRVVVEPDPHMDQGLLSTIHYWHTWLAQSRYKGRWREMVHRSALVLKLLTYAPTGAIVAAPTTSLPESIGGERNWDYRYTWLRDASFTLYALLRIGFTDEARSFMHWLEERLHSVDENEQLPIMFRVDGELDLKEETLDHLDGYMGSRPVRIGNGAHDQLQLDVYGALMDSIYMYDKHAEPITYDLWKSVVKLTDWVCKNYQLKDEGIWEVRGGRKHFVYSKLMCWVALDRAIRLSYKRSLPADRQRWEGVRDTLFREIMEQGWNPKARAFTQHYESEHLDAANLLMPLVLFLAPNDPRMTSTLEAIQASLVSDSLVHRYLPELSSDGLDGGEGTFSICSFWLVECLSRAGRTAEARVIFEKMLGYANHLGLFSEEIGPSGEALGNFPQAFTHIGLISAAFQLDRALGSREW